MILTETYICFYSKFNDKTLFGKSTRIKVPYTSLTLLKKEHGALMLPNSIRILCLVTGEDGKEKEIPYVWTSYINRDECFQLLQTLVNGAHTDTAS